MKTGMGVEILNIDLTHKFSYNGKECPIGLFDPSEYPIMENCDWETFLKYQSHHLYDQLDDSKIFNDNELECINEMDASEFVRHISEI